MSVVTVNISLGIDTRESILQKAYGSKMNSSLYMHYIDKWSRGRGSESKDITMEEYIKKEYIKDFGTDNED